MTRLFHGDDCCGMVYLRFYYIGKVKLEAGKPSPW